MKVISLFSGAGGLDVGFSKAGFDIIWANDFDKDACETYKANLGDHIHHGDIDKYKNELTKLKGQVDLMIGGPPCQGFSVAGKMDPNDVRSKHVWTYCEVVEKVRPKAFVMENVKALGQLAKWEPLRTALLKKFRAIGYAVNFVVVNASDFDVPQARERVLFIGFKTNSKMIPDLAKMLEPYHKKGKTVRQALDVLDKAGTGNNIGVCNAKITLAPNPIMRKSPFAGMLFNGLGRPVKLDGYCATLPASMGGNKTPIIDEEELYCNKPGWVQKYHAGLLTGKKAMEFQEAPKRLRRLTVEETGILQTFPLKYCFKGSQSSKFRQIGNAVPCNLGYRVGRMMWDYLAEDKFEKIALRLPEQLEIEV